MRVFVTGATGFIGSAVVRELLDAGHSVVGLARSDANAQALKAAGAEVHRGDLEDLDSLKKGAAAADGVIHTGFIHDFARFAEVCAIEERAIEAMGSVLVGSARPFVMTSGTALITPGKTATETDHSVFTKAEVPRLGSEEAANRLVAQGVRVSAVRCSPSVHGEGDHGFVPLLIGLARQKGTAAYIGDGANRWSAVHRLDTARLFRLALEHGTAGASYHAVAEEAVPFKTIAEAIGRGLNLPVVSVSDDQIGEYFGWFTRFASIDCPASSRLTRAELGWNPTAPTLFDDLAQKHYFAG